MKYVLVETLEKGVKYVQNTGIFIIDFEHISDLFLVFLLFTGASFLREYYFPKSKDEQMLYLTSFKIASDFLNN